MSRRKKTDGERIADSVFSGRYQSHGRAFPSELAIVIDRIIRKRQREAWTAGYNFREVVAEMEAKP